MTNKHSWLANYRTFLTLGLTACLLMMTHAGQAQISWTPTTASITENAITATGQTEWVNIDMYNSPDGPAAGASGEKAIVIVYDQDNGGTWECKYILIDEEEFNVNGTIHTGTIATNAWHPDVVIGDGGTSHNQGEGVFVVVFEDFSNGTVKYNDYTFSNFFGHGAPSVLANNAVPAPFAGTGTDPAREPHIDAYVNYLNGSFMGGGNTYEPLGKYVVTWTENNSSTDEIYVTDGSFGVAPTSANITYVDDGQSSDIAASFSDDGSTQIEEAFIAYIDNTGYLSHADYDIVSTTVGTITQLETNEPVASGSLPRIEARNVYDPNNIPSYRWIAVAQLDSPVSPHNRQIVRSYHSTTPSYVSYSDYAPLNTTTNEAYNPVIAIGPGVDDYVGNAGQVGIEYYHMAWYIDPNEEFEALEFDYNNVTYNGYLEVNQNTLHSTVRPDAVLGITSSSNNGHGNAAAWSNYDGTGYEIDFKWDGAANVSYKPSTVASVKGSTLTTSPNPANGIVTVDGVKKDTRYVALDITGKKVLTGFVSQANNKIDISSLAPGMYVFTFVSEGESSLLKLVKQ